MFSDTHRHTRKRQNYTAEAVINIYPSSCTSYLFYPVELISEWQRDGEETQRKEAEDKLAETQKAGHRDEKN